MGRIVAIAGGDLRSNYGMNKFIVEVAGKKASKLLFIGTASHDAESYIDNIIKTFGQLNCDVKALCLTAKKYSPNETDEMLAWADIIYVGGGDTFFMMKMWRKYGIDEKLKKIYANDSAVLTGISAGAMCWFNCGHSDSEIFWENGEVRYGWVNDLLNIHNFAYCPHYEERTDSFAEMLKEKDLVGLAMESDTAFVEQNGKISYIKSNELSNAYFLGYDNGKINKQEIEIQFVS